MRTTIVLVMGMAIAACGGDEEVPSCQQAVGHYYESGCAFFDANGNQLSASQSLADCRETLAAVPPSCTDDMDAVLLCLNSTPTPSTTNAHCDCSVEMEALLTCN